VFSQSGASPISMLPDDVGGLGLLLLQADSRHVIIQIVRMNEKIFTVDFLVIEYPPFIPIDVYFNAQKRKNTSPPLSYHYLSGDK